MSSSFLIVLSTFPSLAEARKVSKRLIDKRLAACVNLLGPAESFFWWEGKIDRAKEYLVLIKTKSTHFNRLQKFLEKNHPYSVPEILALPILKGNRSYLAWLQANVRSD